LVTGAAAEPDLAIALAEGQRHVAGATSVVGLLRKMDALQQSEGDGPAAETLAAISDVRVALKLRDDYGWSLDRIESWIASTSQAVLLRPSESSR
jgi:hypothetical protein